MRRGISRVLSAVGGGGRRGSDDGPLIVLPEADLLALGEWADDLGDEGDGENGGGEGGGGEEEEGGGDGDSDGDDAAVAVAPPPGPQHRAVHAIRPGRAGISLPGSLA